MKKRLLTNGRIYTVSGDSWDEKPQSSMLIGEDGRIEYVGEDIDFHEAEIETVDLAGKTVLPGFVDAHVHIPGTALTDLFEVDLFSAKTKENVRDAIEAFADKHPEQKIIFGTGFDMSTRDEAGNEPCAEWIDALGGGRMIILQSNDMHSMLLNTRAMEEAGLLAEGYVYSGGGRVHTDENGKPTGLLTDMWDIALPSHRFSDREVAEALAVFEKKMLAWGYTSIMAIAPFFKGLPLEIVKCFGSGPHVHVNASVLIKPEAATERMAQLISARKGLEDGSLKITTAKYMIDGVVEGNTAFLKEDYSNRAGFKGKPVWTYEALVDSFREAVRNGFQIHAHTIGDGAVKMALDAIAEAQKAEDVTSGRNVLTHMQLVDEADYHKFGENGIVAAVQTFWHFKEPGYYENVEIPALGKRRAEAMYPLRSLKENGAVITASGDYPVSPDNDPMLGIQMGVTRNAWEEGVTDEDDLRFLLGKDERLTVKEMIEAYTINGAYQLFREDEIGSLEKGKLADYVVLSGDPLTTDHMKISEIKVLETCLSGMMVYKKC